MSNVTNVLLHYSFGETWRGDRKAIERINEVVSEINFGQRLEWTTESWGGNAQPESDVLAGAFKSFFRCETMKAFAALPWEDPQHVQLFIQNQEQDAFSLYMLKDGAWFCVYDHPEGG